MDIEKLHRISAFYNWVNHLALFKPMWATDIISAWAVWLTYKRSMPKTLQLA